jgi:hypothetical protein
VKKKYKFDLSDFSVRWVQTMRILGIKIILNRRKKFATIEAAARFLRQKSREYTK